MDEPKKKRHRRTKLEMQAYRASLVKPSFIQSGPETIQTFTGTPGEPLTVDTDRVNEPKKVPKPLRDINEKVEWLLEDFQSLRNYMCRFEDAFAAARKAGYLIQMPEKPVFKSTRVNTFRKR